MSQSILSLLVLFLVACSPSHSQITTKGFLKTQTVTKKLSKSTGYFRIEIKTNSIDEDRIELIASITAQKNMKQVDYEWKLPHSLEPLNGDLKSSLDFNQQGTHQVSITLGSTDLNEGEQIFFFVYNMKNGERHGASASFVFSKSSDVNSSGIKQKSHKAPKYFE